ARVDAQAVGREPDGARRLRRHGVLAAASGASRALQDDPDRALAARSDQEERRSGEAGVVAGAHDARRLLRREAVDRHDPIPEPDARALCGPAFEQRAHEVAAPPLLELTADLERLLSL